MFTVRFHLQHDDWNVSGYIGHWQGYFTTDRPYPLHAHEVMEAIQWYRDVDNRPSHHVVSFTVKPLD